MRIIRCAVRASALAAVLIACQRPAAVRNSKDQPARNVAGEAKVMDEAARRAVASPAELSQSTAQAADALGAAARAGRGDDLPPGADPSTSAMVIRTGNASVEVDSIEPAVTALRDIALRVGGYVGNTAIQAGRDQSRSATLELRVPSARFDDVVAGLRPIGRVEYVNVSAEDVGEEFVDVTARETNARKLEERLIDLLATRTGKLSDVLQVERELARVREEIERYDGRLRYLRARSVVSTLSVSLHEPRPIVAAGENPIEEALRTAWRNLVALTAGAIALTGYLIPLAILGAAAIFLLRRSMGAYRRRLSDAR
ncbi:MAG TPA: DUF4349 domain-containing protein [Gemmatimonadales bacterium]|nr:DUF4349 domain-containing protein [Gemmatimonadales bacterium]